jgi:hypothetical protein
VRHEITWYPDRSQAILVETHELRKHRPLCNPVIPDRTGKHSTVTAGRKPVQSLWAQVDEIARQNGMTVMDVIYGELDRYVRRHRGHAPTEGGTT